MIGKQFLYTITEYKKNPSTDSFDEIRKTSRTCHRPNFLDFYSYQLTFLNQEYTFRLGTGRLYPGCKTETKGTDVLTVHFVVDGKGEFNGQSVHAGQCFYEKPNQNDILQADENNPWELIWFSVRGNMAEKIISLLEQSDLTQPLDFSHAEQLQQLTAFFLHDFSYTYNTAFFVDGIVQQMFSFIHLDKDIQFDPNKASTHTKELVSEAIQLIEKDLPNVSVNSLAVTLHLDRKYFSKIFYEVIGIAPKDYITDLKMNMVEHYLSKTDYSLDKIMGILGYSHRNSLSTAFKNRYGYSPMVYREKLKIEKEKKQNKTEK